MIFKLCPHCGGPVVRLTDGSTGRYLSCQRCTWTEPELPTPPVEPPLPAAVLPGWVHWVMLVFALVLLAVLFRIIFK
jgi:hypothetical protein